MSTDELMGDPRRQAVASIRGTVYQAWCSIDAWLRLGSPDQVIFLEGAEDFDVIGCGNGDIAVQVKRNEGSISLGNAKAHEALENYWAMVERDPTRLVFMHYLSTSAAVVERDAAFGGLCGLDAWRAARTNPQLAQVVANYVAAKLATDSVLRQFLSSVGPEDLQERLFRRFHWFTDQPDIDAVQRSVEDRVSVLLASQRRAVSLASKVRVQLESRFWQVITEEKSALRCLTLGDLLRQIESATTAYLPVPVEQIPDLLAASQPGLGLLKLLVQKVPQAPSPLIPRPDLANQVKSAVDQRRVALLTGTVYKGKTTIAQQVVEAHCPGAWWVNLTDRRPDQVDNVLLALASQLESGDCPGLVVIDDLDISPLAHRTYRDSLSLLLHRARAAGQGLILTAQGGSSDSAQMSDFGRLDVIDVPELTLDEVKALCVQEGCSAAHVEAWSFSVHTFTRGHPKLVQVRLIELSAKGWPAPTVSDLVAPSQATLSARQLARHLFSQSVPPGVAEFLYCASECSVLLHRSVAVRLAESLGLVNGGDVLDSLTGRWVERIEGEWHRTTPLLQGSANEVWSSERRQLAHIQLHDAILLKQTLNPSEAAALLYHAYFGRDWNRAAHDALRLQVVDNEQAKREVERNLLWLPFVALEPGQLIAGSARTGAPLRSLQYRVAVTLDADAVPRICDRWAEELAQLTDPLLSQGMYSLMWNVICISESPKVPLRHRLTAIKGITTLTGEVAQLSVDGTKAFLESNAGHAGIPLHGSQTQLMLALTTRWVRSAESLSELVQWLDTDATDELRADFNSILDWPLVQTMGAFVQGAWAASHETTKDWTPWIDVFTTIEDYAVRRGAHRFGREAAKGKSIVFTEYMNDREAGIACLDAAEVVFGRATVLDEQRANVLFQTEDDEEVLKIWQRLLKSADAHAVVDPFAYRRAAISAYRLGRRADAIDSFRAGANCMAPEGFALTRFGMLVDCALVELQDSQIQDAAKTLAAAVLELPTDAGFEGGERWEPVQRGAVEVCRCIENALWKPTDASAKIEVGAASSPASKLEKTEPGQAGRTLLLRAQGARLAATHGLVLPKLGTELDHLCRVPYRAVRWTAAEGKLAWSLCADAHAEFIEALVNFDLATTGLGNARTGDSIVMPDESVDVLLQPCAERWFGLLIAGAWCTNLSLIDKLNHWLGWLQARPENVKLQELVVQLRTGAEVAQADLEDTVRNCQHPPAVRCGSALKLLSGKVAVVDRLRLQGFLMSAVVSDVSYARQEVFNLHLARRIAGEWRLLCESPFNFRSSGQTVPSIIHAAELVEQGRGTLKTVLTAINVALGNRPPEYMKRVW
jgi:hypothetical protein